VLKHVELSNTWSYQTPNKNNQCHKYPSHCNSIRNKDFKAETKACFPTAESTFINITAGSHHWRNWANNGGWWGGGRLNDHGYQESSHRIMLESGGRLV
jgi:hypothetical protein